MKALRSGVSLPVIQTCLWDGSSDPCIWLQHTGYEISFILERLTKGLPIVPMYLQTSLSLWMPRRHLKISIAIFYSKPFSQYLIFCLLCCCPTCYFLISTMPCLSTLPCSLSHIPFKHPLAWQVPFHLFQSCSANISKALLTMLTYCFKFFSINIRMNQVSLSFVTVP